LPEDRLSSTVTLQPAETSVSTKCDPINPAPPVTNALLKGSFIIIFLLYNGAWATDNYQIDYAPIEVCIFNRPNSDWLISPRNI
jgi:hypothetical protein